MQIDTKRYLAETGRRPMLTAAVLAPAVPTTTQGAPLPSRLANLKQLLCERQAARSIARTACLERKITPKHDGAVAMPDARDGLLAAHAVMLRATPAVPPLKESLAADQQGRLAEAFLSPLGAGVSVRRAFVQPGMGPPGLGLGPPGFAARQPPARR
jgi:hypothetical protein